MPKMPLSDIRARIQTLISNKSSVGSITPNNVGDPMEDILDSFVHQDSVQAMPQGSAVARQIRFNPDTDRWEAISDVRTVYGVLVPQPSPALVIPALLAGLQTGTTTQGEGFSFRQSSRPSFQENSQSGAILNVWTVEEQPPYIIVLTPNAVNWVDDFNAVYEYTPPDPEFLPVRLELTETVERNKIRINGTNYDWSYARIPIGIPQPEHTDSKSGHIIYSYTLPPATPTETTVEEIL